MTTEPLTAHRNQPQANGDFSCRCGVWGSHGWMGYALHIEDAARAAEADRDRLAERYRFGWCCDFDFDNGTYRSTPECIGRTRNADAVERGYRAEVTRLRVAISGAAQDLCQPEKHRPQDVSQRLFAALARTLLADG